MKAIDEIVYYCTQENCSGALLITGSWGCGKTYFINNTLQKCAEVSENFFVLRVSLFGVNSVNELHRKVQQAYINKLCNYANPKTQKALDIVHKVGGIIEHLPKIGKPLNAIISLDWSSMIDVSKPIEIKSDKQQKGKQINKKSLKPLLVFDDFERCELKLIDKLGSINEYVENKSMKVIIVADESKCIASTPDDDSKTIQEDYRILKEKVVYRTISYTPDMKDIVEALIQKYDEKQPAYAQLLRSNIPLILNVFSESKSTNIRSLKCGIQDFERVYNITRDYSIDSEQEAKLLTAFLIDMFEYKAGKLKQGEFGFWNASKDIEEKYSMFSSGYAFDSIRLWITQGIWERDVIDNDMRMFFQRITRANPEDIILLCQLCNISDDELLKGYPLVLDKAYSSKLTLDEYVTMLILIGQARLWGVKLPCEHDAEKIACAIQRRMDEIVSGIVEEQDQHQSINESVMEALTDVEKKCFELVNTFSNCKYYRKNREVYIDFMNGTSNDKSVYELADLMYLAFDEDMLQCTFEHYRNSTLERQRLASVLCKIWDKYFYVRIEGDQGNVDITLTNLSRLSQMIETQCCQGNIPAAIDHFFIDHLNDIVLKNRKTQI